jgi:hypothetical protein
VFRHAGVALLQENATNARGRAVEAEAQSAAILAALGRKYPPQGHTRHNTAPPVGISSSGYAKMKRAP